MDYTHTIRTTACLAALSAALGAGCTNGNEELGAAEAAIYRGEGFGEVDDDTPEANTTVWVNACTGSLVAPDLVLTAAHCIQHPPPTTIAPAPPTGASSTASHTYATDGMRIWRYDMDDFYKNGVGWGASVGHANAVSGMTAIDGMLYAVRETFDDLWVREARTDDRDLVWTKIGHCNDCIALASTSSSLYTVSNAGYVWRRDRVHYEKNWSYIGNAFGAVALAADTHGHLFGLFSDGSLRVSRTSPISWTTIGSLPGYDALDYHDGFLHAASSRGSSMKMRLAVPYEADWIDNGSAYSAAGIGVTTNQAGEHTVFRAKTDNRMYARETFAHWNEVSTNGGTALTALEIYGSTLYAGRGAALAYRPLSHGGPGGWRTLTGHTQKVRSLARYGTYLYMLDDTGMLFRRTTSTSSTAGWRSIGGPDPNLRSIAASPDGYLYGVTGKRLMRRRANGFVEEWQDVNHANGLSAITISDGNVVGILPYAELAAWPLTGADDSGENNWVDVPKQEHEDPLTMYPLARPATVLVGNDRTNPRMRVSAGWYAIPTDTDMVLLALASPVPSSIAETVEPLTESPFPSSWYWRYQDFDVAGWGVSNRTKGTENELHSRLASGSSWTLLDHVFWSTASMTTMNGNVYTLSYEGRLVEGTRDGGYDEKPRDLRLFEITSDGANLFASSADALFLWDDADSDWDQLERIPSGVLGGESITALASTDGFIFAFTDGGRIIRRRADTVPGRSWSAVATYADDVHEADGYDGWLYVVRWDGVFERIDVTDWTAEAQPALSDFVAGLAVDAGVVLAGVGQNMRLRNRDDAYRGIVSEHRITVSGVNMRQGDSGGPLYWRDDSGKRYVIGELQDDGNSYTTTFHRGGTHNTGGWLEWHMGCWDSYCAGYFDGL